METYNDDFSKESILIVDDNPTNLDVLFYHLDEAGFKVFVAEDGDSAVRQAKYTTPDLILLDVMMPGIDGFETCRLLKDNTETKHIPVIFMTALTEVDSKLVGFEVGAADYVTKPLQYKEVLARVTTHITIGNLRKELETQNEQLLQEVTRRKAAEEDLQQQTNDLQVRNQELDAFAHSVAHDIKGPLTEIMGITHLLLMKPENNFLPEDEQDLQTILQATHRMNRITDELLLLSKVRETEVTLYPLNMNNIVQESLDRLNLMITESNAKIVISTEWPAVFGYSAWIEEVWVNYISNAIKYGGNPPEITLGAMLQDNGCVRFWVQDNGKGLTEAEQASLFTKFTRLPNKKIDGYGLGLSIVQRIIKKCGGHVGVESQVNKGSIFYFTLQKDN